MQNRTTDYTDGTDNTKHNGLGFDLSVISVSSVVQIFRFIEHGGASIQGASDENGLRWQPFLI
ncbi:MAG: hypothetical protein WCL16_04050 [bacterium]